MQQRKGKTKKEGNGARTFTLMARGSAGVPGKEGNADEVCRADDTDEEESAMEEDLHATRAQKGRGAEVAAAQSQRAQLPISLAPSKKDTKTAKEKDTYVLIPEVSVTVSQRHYPPQFKTTKETRSTKVEGKDPAKTTAADEGLKRTPAQHREGGRIGRFPLALQIPRYIRIAVTFAFREEVAEVAEAERWTWSKQGRMPWDSRSVGLCSGLDYARGLRSSLPEADGNQSRRKLSRAQD
ncbi:hypothetical protein B0H16DRAFT_1467436 [Mycena metata]|uniref:Uncharacterized protein n=1 Tax=Mycena metata TaxID=1033252 RepID=A0AAD7I4H4_9AGAR|nr:hypothetical protein B0H16DRAFT_1467436 [Mycena metata]